MRVRIDEPRCDDEPIGIYGFGRAAIDFADARDAPAADGDVAAELCGTGAVDDGAVLDQEVMSQCWFAPVVLEVVSKTFWNRR